MNDERFAELYSHLYMQETKGSSEVFEYQDGLYYKDDLKPQVQYLKTLFRNLQGE